MIPLPLNMEDPWGINQPYHPTVVYTQEGLFGHRYWMAQTPYPIVDRLPYRDRYEVPCVYYSDDGIKWTPINNPIDDLTEIEIEKKCYFSDPHLVKKNDTLELYYRLMCEDEINILYKRISTNGLEWSERIVVIDLHEANSREKYGNDIISPAITWSASNGYRCWYVDDVHTNKDRHVRLIQSIDGLLWTTSVICKLDNDEIIPWHIDVQYIDGRYEMLVFDVDNQSIDWFKSIDGYHFKYFYHVIHPSRRKWDFYEVGLYRACLVKYNDDYLIYFSAHNQKDSCIGLIIFRNGNILIVSGQSSIKTLCWNIYVYYKKLRKWAKQMICRK